jgi:hypothetical protein
MCGRYSITLPPEAIRQILQTGGTDCQPYARFSVKRKIAPSC